ncbi:MAG TPA: hypothetical protein VF883_05990, partial [Thermoanaerobaculia bacterium]
MLKFLRRRWLAATVVAVLLLGGATAYFVARRGEGVTATHAEPDLPSKAEAPPDLQKLRDAYAAGVAALEREDGADAVKHLSSFTFGPRAVEEYRLYYLSNAYQLAGNPAAARATLARLWRRQPKMIHANDAGLNLAKLYEDTGDFDRSADVYAALGRRADAQDVIGKARWNAARARLQIGDVAGALYNARAILIESPGAKEASNAGSLVRTLHGLPQNAPPPLTPNERMQRIIALRNANKAQQALDELTGLERVAPAAMKMEIQLQRGLALHQLRRFEDSNKVLEPLTSGPFKYA